MSCIYLITLEVCV